MKSRRSSVKVVGKNSTKLLWTVKVPTKYLVSRKTQRLKNKVLRKKRKMSMMNKMMDGTSQLLTMTASQMEISKKKMKTMTFSLLGQMFRWGLNLKASK